MYEKEIETGLRELSDDLKREALDFIEFLASRSQTKAKRRKLRMDWQGGLAALRDQFTSVDLQHKATEWR